jgi:hypothetical protein
MRGRIVNVVVTASVVVLVLAMTGAASAAVATPRGMGPLLRAHRGHRLPRHGGTVSSLNWSGYAVTPSARGVTALSSTFTVPAAGLLPPGFAATWTGIGGYGTNDLIQAGTAEQSIPTLPLLSSLLGDQYYAWYELLPGAEIQLTGCTGDANCTVTPGDQISVGISQLGPTQWSISMTNAGHWSWSQDVTYSSSGASAEWILEAPTLLVAQTLLAPVGTVAFGPTSTYTAGGVTHTIAQGNPTQINLSLGGLINLATPSPLGSGGQSFNDCAYQQSCAGP